MRERETERLLLGSHDLHDLHYCNAVCNIAILQCNDLHYCNKMCHDKSRGKRSYSSKAPRLSAYGYWSESGTLPGPHVHH